ncbi:MULTISPECIES: hypothetical protein [unclassified Streptomyces]|uniref:hypothetical protein n=1 Tax=unclassified Streptomyces TaxID=2593676 RepID=UPI0008F2A48C|nr:hypothetical protein [Streptomyces sp. ok210]SFT19929.1 hypothetical protein SAMN04487982_109273 [Streptomyces sp. ok210]
MIATTPVARWTWGRDNQAADKVVSCLHELLTAYTVLARHRLASDVPNVSLSVHEAGKSNSYLFQGNFELDATSPSVDIAHQLADQVKNSRRPGTIGAVYAYAKSTGMMPGGNGALHGGELFRLGASAFVDYVSTDLVTFSDLWMPYDLKGRAQPAVHAANAPRLAAALRDLAEALGSETDPDDPTYFGKPTETGIDNYFDDGIASDVWSRFEIPYRYNEFTHAPGFGRIGYRRSADGEVQYVPVHGEHGVLGYLWASDTENAASFEPRDVEDDESYTAGLQWLDRLRSAHDRGLSPSQALAELAGLTENNKPGTLGLASLRGIASK